MGLKRQPSQQPPESSSQSLELDARLYPKPDYSLPDVPLDLTMVDDGQLMTIFAKAVGWQNFAASVASELEVMETDMEIALATEEANVMLASWTGAKEDRVALSRAKRDQDPAVIQAAQTLNKCRSNRKRAQTVRDNSERVANLVSRELTRRVGRDPVERRNSRWNP